ncbi:MAG: MBL fold metallo-hydrolase, partial [Betaproteobacteria bacterium]
GGLPILRVLVTHMHPDHIGLASWLCERWQAPLWISSTDYNAARMACLSTTGFGGEAAARFFAAHGLSDPEAQERIRARTGYYPSLVPAVAPSYYRMMDGDLIAIGSGAQRTQWRCISGYGHAPEHIALYCEQTRMLISGDMVLPRISTNVSVYDIEPESNPLKLFLTSLERYRDLAPDTLTLPSHGKPFQGLHTRLDQLAQHHRDRLSEVLQACSERPHSAADMLMVLFKRALDLHQTTFAMGESVAHLHALWFEGQLTRSLDADGVYRFAAARP